MNRAAQQQTKFWLLPQFEGLELFRANAIHYHYARHFHSGYSIGVIEAGVGGNYYRGATYLAPPKSIVLMNPEEAHTGFSAEGLPLTYRMLYLAVDWVQAIAQELQLTGTPYFKESVVRDDGLANQILSVHTLLEQSQHSLAQETVLVDVLSAILHHYTGTKTQLADCRPEHRAIRLVKDYLHDNFNSDISLAQLVEVTNLNRSYLIRVSRQAVGMPPYTYLNQIRIEKAKQLLKQDMAIAEIAIAVGMADQSHLTRHFKQIVGISPGQYRIMSTSFKTE